MRIRIVAGAVLLGVATVLGFAAIAASAAASHKVVPVYKFNTTEVVPNAVAQLTRTDAGVSGTIISTGLEPNHAHTLWWVVFNNPEGCDGPCDIEDVLVAIGSGGENNPANIGVFSAGGHYVGAIGAAGFGASLREGDTSFCESDGPLAPMCNPLVDSHTAIVGFVVRDHGPMIPGQIQQQISAFTGGCSVNTCENVQMAHFLP